MSLERSHADSVPVAVRLSKDFTDALRCRWPHEQAHRRHRRPPQRRQVHPLQPHPRRPSGHRIGAGRAPPATGTSATPSGRAAASGWSTPAAWCPTRTTRWIAPSGSQVEFALDEADVVVFVVDGREGLNPVDRAIAERLRKAGRPVLLAVNKLDDLEQSTAQYGFYSAGLRRSGRGERRGREGERRPAGRDGRAAAALRSGRGRGRPSTSPWSDGPTSGKSSLVNRLLGEERHVVAPEAGTTRDAIDSPLALSGQDPQLHRYRRLTPHELK